MTSTISTPSQPQSTFTSSCIPRGIRSGPIPAPGPSAGRPLSPTFSQLHYCTQPGRSNKLSQKSVVSCSQFTMSLARPHPRLGFKSSRSASLCGAGRASSVFRSLRARSSRAFPLVYWQVALRALPTSTSQIGLRVVPLVRVLELSPDCQSTPGVMLLWLGLVFLARASSHFLPILCLFFSSPSAVRLALFFFKKTKITFGYDLITV